MSTESKDEVESVNLSEAGQKYQEAEEAYFASNDCKDHERVALLKKARALSLEAHELEPENMDYLRQLCSATGRLAEESGMIDKINLGFEFKKYLDKAIEMDKEDDPCATFELRHMRGRFIYTVANLSLIERTLARAIANLPEVDIDQAIEDLLKADTITPDLAENQLYIGKCYMTKGDFLTATTWFTKAANGSADNVIEAEYVNEAKNIINGGF